jgi:haloalkane dehalogenase
MNSPYPERPKGKVRLPPPIYLFRAPVVGELFVKGLGAFTKGFIFKAGLVHRDRITPEIRKAYLAPHPSWSSRTSVLAFPRQIPTGPEDLAARLGGEAEQGLAAFRDRPVKMVWAMKDVSFSEDVLRQWTGLFPDADVMRIDDAGHCLQEDAHERIVPALLEFVEADTGPATGEHAELRSNSGLT